MKKIVTIGGGTGNFVLLNGLKKYPVHLSAVVTMFDDGGSSGVLQDELGVLPSGDVRQCLVALSEHTSTLRKLFTYRFGDGFLAGHNAGNIFLSALEKITGSFNEAVKEASNVLHIKGKVLPVTLDKSKIIVTLQSGKKIIGEHQVFGSDISTLKKYELKPRPKLNPEVKKALYDAHVIIIGPGDVYSSLLPHFFVPEMVKTFHEAKAKKIFVCNLMTKQGHTDGFQVNNFVEFFEKYNGGHLFDVVIYNNKIPGKETLRKYAREGEKFVDFHKDKFDSTKAEYIGLDLVSKKFSKREKKDLHQRNLIRHNPEKLAKAIMNFL